MKQNKNWTENYAEQITRNIGIVSLDEQDKIKNSTVAVLGVGGLGAPLAINLALAGCESFVVADFDVVERSNLNRLPYSEAEIGQKKIDVIEKRLKAVNSNIRVRKHFTVNESTIGEILKDVDVIALTLDGPAASILIAREARRKKIPLVETWVTPYIFAWWFTDESTDYETSYGLDTHSMSTDKIESDNDLQKRIKEKLIGKMSKFPGIMDYYSREENYLENMLQGKIGLRSFAPFVWLNSANLANEVLFAGILNLKPKTLAPEIKAINSLTFENFRL